MAKTTVELPEVLHRTLRVKAALENRSMNDIVIAALMTYLRNFRLEPEMLEVETIARGQTATQSASKES
jgi:plasmid stability protein